METDKIHIVFKTVIIGDARVGKTSLLVRISDNRFYDPHHAPKIGIDLDFRIRMMDVDGEKIKLTLWDTMGQEKFRTITRSFYRGTHGVILAYDITSRDSFNNLRGWIKDVDENGGDQMAKIIIGNKLDLMEKRIVSYKEARDFADTMGIPYFETSAKTSSNVEDAFFRLTAEMKRLLDSSVFKMSVNPPVKLQEDRELQGGFWWPCEC